MKTFFCGHRSGGWRFAWVLLLLSTLFCGLSSSSFAGVYLSSYNFTTNNLPYIYSDDALPQPYRLRAKVQGNYHATQGWNNNWMRLESVPGTGTYTVELYLLKYDINNNLLEIGPANTQTITISDPPANRAPQTNWVSAGNVFAGQATSISGNATDLDGNLASLNFYINGPDFPGWNYIGTASVSGGNATASITWTPPKAGGYAVHVRAVDSSGAWDSNGNIMNTFTVSENHPPVTTGASAGDIQLGQSATLSGSATDQDSNLNRMDFYVNGPGLPGWNYVGARSMAGGSDSASLSWTPTQAGRYNLHIRAIDSMGVSDSNASIVSSFSVRISQASVWSQNATINLGSAFTPAYNGGSGSGVWQFCVANYTNWGGTQTGTLLDPGYVPSASWTPSSPGTYQFWICKRADDTYLESNIAGTYTLTVNAPFTVTVDGGSASPAQGFSGQNVALTAETRSGFTFDQWSLVTGSGTIASPSTSSSNFTIGGSNALVRASFRDIQAPTTPGGLGIASVSTSAVSLSWSASTDNVGVTGYQIRINGGTISSCTSTGYTWSSLSSDTSYSFEVRAVDAANNCSGWTPSVSATTAKAVVAPTISSQPASQTVTEGSTVTLSVSASGYPSPGYQWLKNGNAIAGATSATFILVNVTSANAGSYAVLVTNSAGNVTSNVATITVNPAPAAPVISTQPASQSVAVGASALFSVAATGVPAPTYQWRKDNIAISGATSSTLSLSNVTAANAGSYTVVVTNSAGSVTSNAAVLTVGGGTGGTSGQNEINVHTPHSP